MYIYWSYNTQRGRLTWKITNVCLWGGRNTWTLHASEVVAVGLWYTYAMVSIALCCNDTHCTRQKAHAICTYGVINVSVQAKDMAVLACFSVSHHHLFPRPESIFDKRQLRSQAIRCCMDVYGERVIIADSHETWHWWVDHVRPSSIHWIWKLTVVVDKQVQNMNGDIMNPLLSHLLVITQPRIFHIYLRWHLKWISVLKLEAGRHRTTRTHHAALLFSSGPPRSVSGPDETFPPPP
jgi:hypothetical protein